MSATHIFYTICTDKYVGSRSFKSTMVFWKTIKHSFLFNFLEEPNLSSQDSKKEMASVPSNVKSKQGSAKHKLVTKNVTCNWARVENTFKILWSKTFAYFIHFDSTYLQKRQKNIYIFFYFLSRISKTRRKDLI